MQPKNVVYKKLGLLGCGRFLGTRYQVRYLCKAVYKHCYGTLALLLWYISDQVECHLLLGSRMEGNWL